VSHFREFGCDVWVLNQGEKQSKLAPKSTKMKLMGFLDSQKAIRYYDPTKRTIRVSRNVAFNENDDLEEISIITNLPGFQSEGELEPEAVESQTRKETPVEVSTAEPKGPSEVPKPKQPEITYPPRPSRAVDRDYRKLNNPMAQPTRREIQTGPVDRPTESSAVKQKEKVSAEAHVAYAYMSAMKNEVGLTVKDPWDLKEAKEAPDWEQWEVAIQEELDQLRDMGVWELVDLPEGREAIGNKWVFV
jgi:hypothetical protein